MYRNYSVAEIAAMYDIHKNTVLVWRKAGLEPIDDRRKPLLFLGVALSAFLNSRRAERKRPLNPGQIYCLPCRDAKEPALGMVEYLPLTATSGNLRGLCPTCGNLIHRRVARDKLNAILGSLEVTLTEAAQRIRDGVGPSANSDFEPTGNT